MAKKKTDTEFTDAKGNTHKHFVDGRAEIYYGGYDKSAAYAEITDAADVEVNRKRFLIQRRVTVEETLQVRQARYPDIDPEEFDPDSIPPEFADAPPIKTRRIGGPEDDAIPGVDLIDDNGDIVDDT